jgi:hypothetical protein
MKGKIIVAMAAIGMAFGAVAQENQNLEVVFNGCDPVEVLSKDDSCGNGPDPVNVACRPDNGPVRWVPVDSIKEISTKAGSPGALHNCEAKPNQGYYQCIVRGNVGDEVAYNVTSTAGCTLDPIIRIRQ